MRILLAFIAIGSITIFFQNCSEVQFLETGEVVSEKAGDHIPLPDVVDEEGHINPDLGDQVEKHSQACGNNGDKVEICHIPSGNPDARHTLCISQSALSAHLHRHGANGEFDHLGACDSDDDSQQASDPKKKDGSCDDKDKDGDQGVDPVA